MYTFDNISAQRLPAILLFTVAAMIFTGCIKDDIPYPHIQPNITAIEVENQLQAASIDSTNRIVTLFLDEAADISNVRVTRLELTPGAYVVDTAQIVNGLNLTDSVDIQIGLYYDYTWTITARQTIERYFTVANQVGASEIDVENRTVKAQVPEARQDHRDLYKTRRHHRHHES